MKTIKEKMFDNKQCNVLMQAFKNCAKDEGKSLYDWIHTTPKTSMVVFLVNEINELDYKIIK